MLLSKNWLKMLTKNRSTGKDAHVKDQAAVKVTVSVSNLEWFVRISANV